MERVEKLKQFLETNPADSFVQHALALEYIKVAEHEKARHLFEAILSEHPDYIASYYHLAKLLEQSSEKAVAIEWYEKGMAAARKAGDNHAYNELQGAYEDLLD